MDPRFSHVEILRLAELGELIEAARIYKTADEEILQLKGEGISKDFQYKLLLVQAKQSTKNRRNFERVVDDVSEGTIELAKQILEEKFP